ncbi:unnamed protein product [Adineta steineri]|uniref:Calcineurin-like phosphoesterase domain-containing protein n=1 Tax=Adineta steineri TaxID=433720 RepID=A0A814XNW7_9BILA|nr:unnamed protein product [Adineta steineri]CAF1335823.1 unnamed protein product [Adineta steineri]
MTTNNQHQLSLKLDQLFNGYQYYNEENIPIKEYPGGLQSKFDEFNSFYQPSSDLFRTITPTSRDSGIRIPSSSSSTSTCCSPVFERTSTLKNTYTSEFFLHPPSTKNPCHISYPLNESITPMSYMYDQTSHHSPHRRNVHWNEESFISSREENDLTNIKQSGRHILLNTSLPYYSKLNIRIRTHRDEFSENDQVKAIARIERLEPQENQIHMNLSQQAYVDHYSTITPKKNIATTRIDSPIQYNSLPTHRQRSLPIHEPLLLYIRNGEIYARFFVLLFLDCIHAKPIDTDFYQFALLSDIHIGDTGANALGRARSAVAKINQLVANKSINLQAVFITGDLTDHAMPDQYNTVRTVLNNLTIPYYPIIGNHDQWLYNSTWEDVAPVGDQLFAKTFEHILNQSNIINYPNGTVWNPLHSCQSWFQNYRIQIHNNIFIALDWNSRHHAAASLGYKGSMPGADLYDFNGGTFRWLEEQLQQLDKQSSTIVLLQHQPYRAPFYIPGEIYAFGEAKRLRIDHLLRQHSSLNYFGVFAGHFHMWSDGTAFDNMPKFRQFETDACKVAQAIALVTANIKTGEIIKIEKLYGDEPTNEIK